MTRTLADPGQDTLWDIPAPAVPQQAAPKPRKKTRRFHVLDLPAPAPRGECFPRCLVCGRDEDDGVCGTCSVICDRPAQSTPVEICLIRTHVTARHAGGRVVAVDCPRCSRTHWHSATARMPARVGQCGQPYIIHIPEVAL